MKRILAVVSAVLCLGTSSVALGEAGYERSLINVGGAAVNAVGGLHEVLSFLRLTKMSIPYSWETLNFSGIKFGVGPNGEVSFANGKKSFVYAQGVVLLDGDFYVPKGDMREYLTSFSTKTNDWKAYLANQSCENQGKIKSIVAKKSKLPANMLTHVDPGMCPDLYREISKWAVEMVDETNTGSGPQEGRSAKLFCTRFQVPNDSSQKEPSSNRVYIP